MSLRSHDFEGLPVRSDGQPGRGGTLPDTFFRAIYNSEGRYQAASYNDDFDGGRDSRVTFTPSEGGIYYARVLRTGTEHSVGQALACCSRASGKAQRSIDLCHPVKAEMLLQRPSTKQKTPFNFDIIMVCRKGPLQPFTSDEGSRLTLSHALERAEAQIAKLRKAGWQLSRNDIGVVVMSQVVAEISRHPETHKTEQVFEETKAPVSQTIDRLHSWFAQANPELLNHWTFERTLEAA